MRLVVWLVRAFLFFTLFAFALNNQQPVTVHGFFGAQWQTSLAWMLLLAFAAGALLGVLAMLPNWWRARGRPAAVAATLRDGIDSQAPLPGGGLPARGVEPGAGAYPPRIGL